MFQQFNISRSGFGTYQKMMFNITNNIANAQTPGYKQTRVELATLFPVILQEAEVKYAQDEDLNPYIKEKTWNRIRNWCSDGGYFYRFF